MKNTKSRKIMHEVGSEMKENPPRILAKTRRKKGPEAAEKQRRAIFLSKSRRAGARIPHKKYQRKRARRK